MPVITEESLFENLEEDQKLNLLLLMHAAKCEGECTVPDCPKTKNVLADLRACTEELPCNNPRCATLRRFLTHSELCKTRLNNFRIEK